MIKSWRGASALAILLSTLLLVCLSHREQIARGLRVSGGARARREQQVSLEDLLNDLEGAKEVEEKDEAHEEVKEEGELVSTVVPECGCEIGVRRRGSNSSGTTSDVDADRTTCGGSAFARGPGQKVIGYTFFGRSDGGGSERRYFDGIDLNAAAAAELYPGWTVRVYHNLTGDTGLERLCAVACARDNLDLCQVAETPMLGDARWILPTLWRFLPLADGQVEAAAFRDLDSLLSAREAVAVRDWTRSKHAVHVMRDHPNHDMSILAGEDGVNA